ncbi:MAG: hypothetical protein Q6353_013205, partial [Candidatus Sigynarchaeum springense]
MTISLMMTFSFSIMRGEEGEREARAGTGGAGDVIEPETGGFVAMFCTRCAVRAVALALAVGTGLAGFGGAFFSAI